MEKREFEALGDDALGSACARTVMEAYKDSGSQGGEFHSELFTRLTRGQQALFLFWTYYDHAMKSADDFHWWSAYFLPQTNLWSGIKNSLRFFGDSGLVRLLDRLEAALRDKYRPEELESSGVSSSGIYTNPELQALFSQSYPQFQQQAHDAVRRIAAYIRGHPGEFVKWIG